ncbi:hypothetical protein SALBM311S_09160 [Streptomyces alboniger]
MYLGVDRLGAGGAPGENEFQPMVGGATAGLGEETVGEADDLGVDR